MLNFILIENKVLIPVVLNVLERLPINASTSGPLLATIQNFITSGDDFVVSTASSIIESWTQDIDQTRQAWFLLKTIPDSFEFCSSNFPLSESISRKRPLETESAPTNNKVKQRRKNKSVSWCAENTLARIKLYGKDDPPVSAVPHMCVIACMFLSVLFLVEVSKKTLFLLCFLGVL